MTVRLLILGCGYSGLALARRLRHERPDLAVSGTVWSRQAADALPAEGIEPILFDAASVPAHLRRRLGESAYIIQSIPPGDGGDPFLAAGGAEALAGGNLRWIGYLSTVGVYGDHAGAWVDESATCRPSSPRTAARVEAEEGWHAVGKRLGVPLAVFRLAGIYGPGRNAFVNLAAGKAHRIVKPGQVFNRIHVEDIATTVIAALRVHADGVFNVADDEPAPPQDVVTEAARLMGVAPPPEVAFEDAELSPMARSFYSESKRVSNLRTKRRLGVELAYPTYREGLAALWRNGNWR